MRVSYFVVSVLKLMSATDTSRAILMLKQQMARIIARFSDGIGLDDILPIATILHNTVQRCSAWPTPLKRKLLIRALTIIVEKTDFPLIPDELVDPFIIAMIPQIVSQLL